MKNLFFAISLLFSGFLMGQNGITPNNEITPPEIVLANFQKEYPNKVPVWSSEYVGEDNDEIRYIAKFNTINNSKALAIYNISGKLKAFVLAIRINQLPGDALTYLRRNYPEKAIHEANVVVDDKKQTTYEVGVDKNALFYNIVFDTDGKFDVIIQKD
ncbi:MAG TPA: hypothetical protein VIV55_09320 [Flavobacterium sp.]